MTLNQRQSDILEELKNRKRMSVALIAKLFFVSEMTVRRDLKLLEDEGYLIRYNGGAMLCDSEDCMPISFRKLLHSKQKAELAKKVQGLLHNSMNVYIDSSSTCMYIIPFIAEYKNMRIITNSVQNLLAASERSIPCTLVGGDYYKHDMCTVGSISEEFLQNINVDIAFFSSLGLSDDGLITDNDEFQTAIRKIVMKNCDNSIFLFDSHKLHKKCLYTLCSGDDVKKIIII